MNGSCGSVKIKNRDTYKESFCFQVFCVFITLHIMCMCPKNVRLQLIRVVYGLWIIKFHVSLLGKKILKTEQVCVFYVIYMYLAIKRRMKLSLFFLYLISSRVSEILIMFLC